MKLLSTLPCWSAYGSVPLMSHKPLISTGTLKLTPLLAPEWMVGFSKALDKHQAVRASSGLCVLLSFLQYKHVLLLCAFGWTKGHDWGFVILSCRFCRKMEGLRTPRDERRRAQHNEGDCVCVCVWIYCFLNAANILGYCIWSIPPNMGPIEKHQGVRLKLLLKSHSAIAWVYH